MTDSSPKFEPETMKVYVWRGEKKVEEQRKIVKIEISGFQPPMAVPELFEGEMMVRDMQGIVHILPGSVEKNVIIQPPYDIELMFDLAQSKPEFYGDVFEDKSGRREDFPPVEGS